jgi:hypothetical protein
MKVLAAEKPPHMTELDFEVRLEVLTRNLPPQLEAHAQLKQKLAAMRAELTERRELIARREERDLARAIEKAKGDVGPESTKRQRVENSMDRLRRGSLKELRALQKSQPEQDGDTPPSEPEPEPGPGTSPDHDPGPTAFEPGTNPDGPDAMEPAGSTATNGNVGTTGPTAPVATVGDPVNTATVDPTEASDPPQKCRNEPTCQNGSREREVVPERETEPTGAAPVLTRPAGSPSEDVAPTLASALTRPSATLSQGERDCGAAALTRPSATLSQGERDCGAAALTQPPATLGQGEDDLGPYVPKDPALAEIHREIETIRQDRRLRDEARKEHQERQDREMRERREEHARRIDAHFGIMGDRPGPAGHDPDQRREAARPPPPPSGGMA